MSYGQACAAKESGQFREAEGSVGSGERRLGSVCPAAGALLPAPGSSGLAGQQLLLRGLGKWKVVSTVRSRSGQRGKDKQLEEGAKEEREREREEAGDLGFRLPGWNLSSLGSDE